MKKKNLIIILYITILCILFFGVIYVSTLNNDEVVESQNLIENITLENPSTVEIPNLSIEDEEALEEQLIENEGFELQGEIAYETGEYINDESISLGEYKGLVYYSQVDNRWKDKLYTSVGNKSQTIGSSGCGPTAAAMVVSAIKGTILPDKMAEIFVKKGYRSSNNGTYLSAFRWVADYFDIGYKEVYKLDEAINLIKNNYYVVASCGNGLFTTDGHFVVIVGLENNTFKIYDPYLYSGKFNTSTRKGKALVDGNTVYVTVENFRSYANYTRFFCFQKEKSEDFEIEKNEVPEKENSMVALYKRYVKVNTSLNVRSGPGTNYTYIKSLYNGDEVTIYEEQGNWSRIDKGLWVCSDYLYQRNVESKNGIVKVNTSLNVRNGPGINYSYIRSLYNGEKINIYESSNGWYRIGNNEWVIDDYINIGTVSSTVGETKIFKNLTYIYSKSNLTGTVYTYLPNTRVKILENLSGIDKVYVIATGRNGYVKNNVYKN